MDQHLEHPSVAKATDAALPVITKQEAMLDTWSLLPVAALAGGAGILHALPDAAQIPVWATTLALLLGGWGPLWQALTATPWTLALQGWQYWETRRPAPHLPYVQPGTPGARLNAAWARARAWWSAQGAEALAAPLRTAAQALAAALLLSIALGRAVILLTFLQLACAQLATLWSEGSGKPGAGWQGVGLAGLPWLLGATLQPDPISFLPALAVTLLVAFYAQPHLFAAIGPLLAGAYLLWQGQSFATGMLLLLAFPGLLAVARGVPRDEHHRLVAPWLLAMILIMGWVL
ncbi:MAG: hypothetical protein JXB35_11695 [Anaerolineae bacterium]|nr:hypothetical protein [Anaerolineae bacterium]